MLASEEVAEPREMQEFNILKFSMNLFEPREFLPLDKVSRETYLSKHFSKARALIFGCKLSTSIHSHYQHMTPRQPILCQ